MTTVNTELTPDVFLDLLRESFVGSQEVYTQGSCYHVYLMLKSIFPQAVPYYMERPYHIVTEIEGKFYDIDGECDVYEDEDEDELLVYCRYVEDGNEVWEYMDDPRISMKTCKWDNYQKLSTWDGSYVS